MKDQVRSLAGSRWTWLVVGIAVVGGAFYWYRGQDDDKVSYELAKVDRGEIQTNVTSSGAVSPLVTITIGCQVSGQLTQVLVDYNSEVKKGQLLAVIDPTVFLSQVKQAEADLAVQNATIGSNEVAVSNAQVTLAQDQREYQRSMELAQSKLLSTDDLEKSRDTYEQAQNGLKIAQATLANSRAQLVKVKAALDQAQINLSRTQITSPVDGVVIERDVDPGQTVQAAMTTPTLFKIARDLSQIQIETKVDEADIGSIKQKARATFTVDAYPDRNYEGRVAQVRINGTTTSNVVTYSVMVNADNPDHTLLPGMTANVKLITAERDKVLRIPSAALRFRPGGGVAASQLLGLGAQSRPSSGGGFGGPGGGPGGGGGGGRQGGGGGNRGGGGGGGPPGMGGGPGGGGGGAGAATVQRALVEMTPDIMQQLGLTDEQKTQVADALQKLVQKAKDDKSSTGSSNPLGGGMPNFRAMFGGDDSSANRQRMLNALAGILTAEQLQKYQAMSANQTERQSTVYVVGADGKPVAKSVRIGLADDNYTEVVNGLADGDAVIVRARAAVKTG